MSNQNTKSDSHKKIDQKFKVGDIVKPKDSDAHLHKIVRIDIDRNRYYIDDGLYAICFEDQDLYELVTKTTKLVSLPNEIRYVAPEGNLYELCDVGVRPFQVSHKRVNRFGRLEENFHTAYEIFDTKSKQTIDSFDGDGFGSVEDAQRSIDDNKMCILGNVVEKPIYKDNSDGFDYQGIETILDGIDENDFETTNMNLNLTQLEYHRLNRFKYNHCDCGNDVDNGTIGFGLSLEFTYNTIGRFVVAKCPHCKKTANITDYSVW